MLSDVSDEREAAAQLISAQVGANGSVAVHSLLWVGQPGAAAKYGFLRVLKEDGENGRTAFRGLCHLGPAAQDCLSELRSFYDRQAQPMVRIQLATWVGAVDPGSFWAEAEMRVELESQDIERIAGALRILKTWPYLVPIFRTELQQITKSGGGHFDPVDVAELQRNEWRRRFANPTAPSGGNEKFTLNMDLAAKAGALLERSRR